MIMRGFRYKLSPTVAQRASFQHFAGVCRFIYNLALEQRRDWWRQFEATTGQKLNYTAQARELTQLRAEYDWIAAVTQTCQQQALRDLDKAFLNFWRGGARFPSPRKRGINDSFRFQGREVEIKKLNAKWAAIRLPKIGWIKFRSTREVCGGIKNATVSLDPLGWHVSLSCEISHERPANTLPAVGIDRGVINTIALSNGDKLSLPLTIERVDRRYRSAQRVLSRRLQGSRRRAKQLQRSAKLSAKRARIRLDWHHKVSAQLAASFGTVVLEALAIGNMTASAKGTIESPGRNVSQKAGLNRAILRQGWQIFENLLAYKLDERGGTLVKVDPSFTSQTCSDCGTVDKASRKSQARFACHHCGFEAHADHNAAINILRRNTASMRVEEGRWPSVEARTGGVFIHPENPPAAAVGGC